MADAIVHSNVDPNQPAEGIVAAAGTGLDFVATAQLILRHLADDIMETEIAAACAVAVDGTRKRQTNRRNGFRKARWATPVGMITLDVPRLRYNGYKPEILGAKVPGEPLANAVVNVQEPDFAWHLAKLGEAIMGHAALASDYTTLARKISDALQPLDDSHQYNAHLATNVEPFPVGQNWDNADNADDAEQRDTEAEIIFSLLDNHSVKRQHMEGWSGLSPSDISPLRPALGSDDMRIAK